MFGRGSKDEQSKHLCQLCYRHFFRNHKSTSSDIESLSMRLYFRRMILCLSEDVIINQDENILTNVYDDIVISPTSPHPDDIVYQLELLYDIQRIKKLPITVREVLDNLDI